MRAEDVGLSEELAQRLADRVEVLKSLGTLASASYDVGDAGERALRNLAERLKNMYPYGEATYAGQMLQPPHPVAWAAYATTMLLNPNNHALDGGPATSAMEVEAVAALAAMLGVPSALGHLTASGTIANLEALWVARELRPDDAIVSCENAHYTHARMCRVLNARHETIAQDSTGRMDLSALRDRLAQGHVGTVVVTLGTTGLGRLDPLHEILPLCGEYGARVHVDAAYGGFFALLSDELDPHVDKHPFAALPGVDSAVIDPHKHGLQPFGCGCVLFADRNVAGLYAHDSPYTYFSSAEHHLGEISLECTRAGAAAAALWATLQALPLTRGGLGRHLSDARAAALRLDRMIANSDGIASVVSPDLDIVCPFAVRSRTSAITEASDQAFASLARAGWHVAKLRHDAAWFARRQPAVEADTSEVVTLRCCTMKSVHLGVVDELAATLQRHLLGTV